MHEPTSTPCASLRGQQGAFQCSFLTSLLSIHRFLPTHVGPFAEADDTRKGLCKA